MVACWLREGQPRTTSITRIPGCAACLLLMLHASPDAFKLSHLPLRQADRQAEVCDDGAAQVLQPPFSD